MNIRANSVFHAASPILADHSCWLFEGPGVDAFVTSSRAEAEKHAEDLNSDRQRYAVVEFNSVEGWARNVTEEFWRAAPDFRDEYEEPQHGWRQRSMRRMRAFG